MITETNLRKLPGHTGARSFENVATDVLLTYLLQLFEERGIAKYLAFKGGTMLRKMVFGPAGRLSTDLDFTALPDVDRDDLSLALRESFIDPFHDISFEVNDKRDWYETEDGCAVTPKCSYPANPNGQLIKIQVSFRERTILPPVKKAQILPDPYLKAITEFTPCEVLCLQDEEVIAEKIRAGHQRAQVRDLYDLHKIGSRQMDQALVRSLATAKLWKSDKGQLNYAEFKANIENGRNYDQADLLNLLPRGQSVNLAEMTEGVIRNFRFLGEITAEEKAVIDDTHRRNPEAYQALIKSIPGSIDSAEANASAWTF
ncbi:nucleotidyl transferase AbiEii/AbiGii toxin family protein [Dongia sp.]|uniref:nucleotidyl transferase AbiEii/AbiGii toxin family protein n=1 Tax=Dongia sp. TaxID=1977262 RepID=UPI0035B38394